MRNFSSLIVLIIGIILLSSCDTSVSKRYKSTGIALGGGGAKAAAEIGVLEELETMGVHIDYIAGTSMGAVVGGLYAAGYSAKELREMWLKESWLRLFDKNRVCTLNDNNRTFFGVITNKHSLVNRKIHLYTILLLIINVLIISISFISKLTLDINGIHS